jgi:Ran GTPase-activating protein (RanGAP) involved in mRNA processing and transport
MTVKFKDAESLFEGRLRGNQLMLSGRGLCPGEARLIADSPRLLEVTWLDLDDNRLGDEGVKILAASAGLANVQYLNLNGNQVTDEGVKTLAGSPHLALLKRLHLKNNPIRGEGVVALFSSVALGNLSVFQVNDGWTCRKKEGWRYNPQG